MIGHTVISVTFNGVVTTFITGLERRKILEKVTLYNMDNIFNIWSFMVGCTVVSMDYLYRYIR